MEGLVGHSIAERLRLKLRLNPLNVKLECVYTPKFCYLGDTLKGAAYSQFLWKVCHPGKCITPQNCFPLKVNTIRPDKPITVPVQGLNLIIAINKTSKKFKKSFFKVL